MSKISVYIACHKEFNIPRNEYYIPIQVGRELSTKKLDMIGDNGGGIYQRKMEITVN